MTSDYGKTGGGGGDVGGCGGASSAIKERLLPDNRATRQRVNSDPVSNKKCIPNVFNHFTSRRLSFFSLWPHQQIKRVKGSAMKSFIIRCE